jgi:perosamine synthetase
MIKNRKNLILTAGPSITSLEKKYVNDAVINGWNNNWNKYLLKLENSFKKFFKVKYAIPTSSCTGGMHLILSALGIKKGDEVIVPDITWVATASVVKYVGAKPIFVDVNKKTWTMCTKSLEKKITKKTKVIMPVHLYGHPCEMDKIMRIANKHKINVVEDAAPAIGAKFNNKLVGTFGIASAFSFQGAKLLVAGEGGIVLTSNKKLSQKIRQLAAHGRTLKKNKNTFWIEKIGFKYSMSNIQAALCLAQFNRIQELIKKKRKIFSWYENYLKNLKLITLNKEVHPSKSIYWMTTLFINKSKKRMQASTLAKKLKEMSIDTRPIFPSISTYPMWTSKNKYFSKELSKYAINLPSGHNLNKKTVRYISECLIKIIKSN